MKDTLPMCQFVKIGTFLACMADRKFNVTNIKKH